MNVTHFWATVCKMVCPVLLDRCLSYLSVCDVGVLWPNTWMDQNETWHTGRPRPRPHCVRWGSSSPPQKGHSPQFLAYVCCGQTARWIKMPLGTEMGLDPGDIVLDGAQLPPPKKRGDMAPSFRPMSIVANSRPSQLLLSSCQMLESRAIFGNGELGSSHLV